MAKEQAMERAFKGNEQVKQVMERSATDLTQTSNTLQKQMEKALEQARTRTNKRERER